MIDFLNERSEFYLPANASLRQAGKIITLLNNIFPNVDFVRTKSFNRVKKLYSLRSLMSLIISRQNKKSESEDSLPLSRMG
jgi:hypothetical protein